MTPRQLLSPQARGALFDPPTDPATIVRHYTFLPEDMVVIRRRRRDANRLGFAVHLARMVLNARDEEKKKPVDRPERSVIFEVRIPAAVVLSRPRSISVKFQQRYQKSHRPVVLASLSVH